MLPVALLWAVLAQTPVASPVRKAFTPFLDPGDLRPVFPVVIRVGEEADVDAGPAQGLFCDDTSLFTWTAEGSTHLVFRGIKVGKTLCRLGVFKDGLPNRLIELVIESPSTDAGAPLPPVDAGVTPWWAK